MIARARVAAFETLLAVSSERADLPSALALARESLDDDRDRALAGEIASGVLRHRSAIDRLIDGAGIQEAGRRLGSVNDQLERDGRRAERAAELPGAAGHVRAERQ